MIKAYLLISICFSISFTSSFRSAISFNVTFLLWNWIIHEIHFLWGCAFRDIVLLKFGLDLEYMNEYYSQRRMNLRKNKNIINMNSMNDFGWHTVWLRNSGIETSSFSTSSSISRLIVVAFVFLVRLLILNSPVDATGFSSGVLIVLVRWMGL